MGQNQVAHDEALYESEQRYRILFEQAPVGVFIYDAGLVIRECNARFVEILRSTRELLIGLDMRTLRDRSVLPAIEGALQGVAGTYHGPYVGTTAGARITIDMRVVPLRDRRGAIEGGMGVVEDVTERARAEALLRASEGRLAQHVRRSPLGIVSFGADGTIQEWNEAAARIFGWSSAEVIGQSAKILIPEGSRAAILATWNDLVTKRGGERTINENLTKGGRLILCDWYSTALVDEDGRVMGVTSMVDDITERKAAEDALKKSEARFRTLIERAPDAIAVISSERRIVYANAALASLLGYGSPEELIGLGDEVPIDPDDRPILESRKPQLQKSQILPVQEYRMVRRDGSTVHVEVVSMPVEYEGRPAALSFARDLTERRLMQAKLMLAVRMVSVGTLAAGVAHEINNPLAYTMANLDMIATKKLPQLASLLEAADPPAGGARAGAAAHDPNGDPEGPSRAPADSPLERVTQIGEMIAIAREGAERVRSIVRDLKTFSRGDDERRGPVDVRRVLDASINMAWNEIRHRARLVKEYENVPPVEANESRIGQVFLNLLVNAAQALPVGGAAANSIRVRTRMNERGDVVVEVTDTGPGIPAEMQARIFDPFFTTKPVGVGTGLGLWICEGIVTALGGTIAVESRAGQGATFRVVIPPRGAGASPSTAPPPSPTMAAARRGRVLVVDDEVALVRAISSALMEEHDVVATSSGREAMDALARDEHFDVILCDLMMPDVTGMDLYERVKAERPHLASRFVFVTGGAFTPRAREFLDSVVAPRIEKPFDVSKLMDLIRKCVALSTER